MCAHCAGDPTLQQLSPTPTVYQPYVDFQQMRYGGLGSGELVSGGVFQVPPSTVGCDAADYAGLQLGSMALVPLTSNCTTYTQAVLAQTVCVDVRLTGYDHVLTRPPVPLCCGWPSRWCHAALYTPTQAGASALLQYVTAQQALSNVRVRNVKWQPNDTVVEIPAFSISYSLGQTLRLTSNIQLALSVNAVQSIEHTYNVICDTGSAKTSPNVVVIGAHLGTHRGALLGPPRREPCGRLIGRPRAAPAGRGGCAALARLGAGGPGNQRQRQCTERVCHSSSGRGGRPSSLTIGLCAAPVCGMRTRSAHGGYAGLCHHPGNRCGTVRCGAAQARGPATDPGVSLELESGESWAGHSLAVCATGPGRRGHQSGQVLLVGRRGDRAARISLPRRPSRSVWRDCQLRALPEL